MSSRVSVFQTEQNISLAPTSPNVDAPEGTDTDAAGSDLPVVPHAPAGFNAVVQAHVDGAASEHDIATLEAYRTQWIAQLLRLLDDAEADLDDARRNIRGRERSMVLADLDAEAARIDAVLTELAGPPQRSSAKRQKGPVRDDTPVLQLSWQPDTLVAWAGGWGADSLGTEQIIELLEGAGASGIPWEPHTSVKLPDGATAESVAAPMEAALGWLVSLASTAGADGLGVSPTWLGLVAALAVESVAQGRIIPQIRKGSKPEGSTTESNDPFYEVRWQPALVEPTALRQLAEACPGAARALENKRDGRAFTQAVLDDIVDAIVMTSLDRLTVPAGPPVLHNRSDAAEAFLANLGGGSFQAPARLASELARKLDQWTKPVSQSVKHPLVVTVDPPDESNAWHLKVLAPGDKKSLDPVEQAMVTASTNRSKQIKDQLVRLERLYDVLLRPGGTRRGQVMLSQDEAWSFMTTVGPMLAGAGYDVRVPNLSKRKPTPSLRMTAEEAQDSVVGAQQLANVRWSAVFDDIELSAEEIRRLAAEARPLIQTRGQWVELDKADLAQAARALADRADQTRLSGADMLRHALGLEGSSLAGGISIAGEGWAADLLRSARNLPEDLPTKPEGFEGELRTYQADGLAWLGFLDSAGLGGCLALDMGLGKTPTMLAHIALADPSTKSPALVIAPPAVVGNWAAEAKKFTPDVRVLVHHGASRAAGTAVGRAVEKVDLVITTYGTAVRDMHLLEAIEWDKVVLDEAQAIKNPASDTAQQLRRLNARTRIALTGTPIENGLGDLWAILDFTNPGLVGTRSAFVSQLGAANAGKGGAEDVLRALNGLLVFRRTKAEPAIAAELPDRIDELDHCAMTPEQIGLYQAVLDNLVKDQADEDGPQKKGAVLAAITALKQICNHPVNFDDDGKALDGRSGKLARLNEIIDTVFAAGERILIFTHFATWGERLAEYLTERTGQKIACYHGGLGRTARDKLVHGFQSGEGAGAMVLSLKAGGTGLNLTAANHVVLYDRWWNPAVEDQARDRVWRIGQKNKVVCHRLVCPGTVDERVEEVVAGKRQIADLVLPKSSSIGDLNAEQLQAVLGIDPDALLASEEDETGQQKESQEVPAA